MTSEAVNGASRAFKKALIERALGAELGHHLEYANGAVQPEAVSKQRNGSSGKTVLTEDGPLRIEVPRDRDASFGPLFIPSTSAASPAWTIGREPTETMPVICNVFEVLHVLPAPGNPDGDHGGRR